MGNVSLQLEESILERVKKLAAKTGRTKTFYMTQAISLHIEDLENIYDAEQELLKIRLGKSRTYTLVEVEAKLGLEKEFLPGGTTLSSLHEDLSSAQNALEISPPFARPFPTPS